MVRFAPSHDADAPQGGWADESRVDAAQMERDIAEIAAVRDRLLSEPVQVMGRTRRFGLVRTSDCVPILVGGILAFTALVVFGAAASFVSLR